MLDEQHAAAELVADLRDRLGRAARLSASSRPAAGSSRSRNFGSTATARAMPTRRSSPCGSADAGQARDVLAAPGSSISSPARSRACCRLRPAPSAPSSTFSKTVRLRERGHVLERADEAQPDEPLRRPAGDVVAVQRDACRAVSGTKPLTAFMNVVLPAPLGPISPMI